MKRSEAIESIRRICKFKHYALSTEETYVHRLERGVSVSELGKIRRSPEWHGRRQFNA